jgi:hypothetical protein
MAVSTIKKDNVYLEIPYSSFTWNETNKEFTASVTIPSGYKLIEYVVNAANGTVVLGARKIQNGVKVCGFVPTTGAPITSVYTFTCHAILSAN